jgi:hypothetical protein
MWVVWEGHICVKEGGGGEGWREYVYGWPQFVRTNLYVCVITMELRMHNHYGKYGGGASGGWR